jgi:hypothetical protein
MSKSQTTTTNADEESDGELFERLAERYADEDERFAELCLRIAHSIEESNS